LPLCKPTHSNCTTVQYMHCHITLSSKTSSEQFKQQNNSYKYSLMFSPPTARPSPFYQSTPSVHTFLTHYSLLSFRLLFINSLPSVSLTVKQQIPTHRPYKLHSLQLHQTQYFSPFWSQLALYNCYFIDILRSYWKIN
jgi:hypothetical protein